MTQLEHSRDTAFLEVAAELGADGRLSPGCSAKIISTVDREGFAVITGLLSHSEAAAGLGTLQDILADPNRETSSFASGTDIAYGRRDFCPLPPSKPVMGLAATLTRRLQDVLLEYCGRTRPIVEVSTLVSYLGSSHQYLHRDPTGVIAVFAALDDVEESQGGTVFAPRTHEYSGTELEHDGKSGTLLRVFQTIANWQIFRRNVASIFRMRKEAPRISTSEFWSRFFSTRSDRHQPNLARFLLGRNQYLDIRRFSPRDIWNLVRYGRKARSTFGLVQVAPRAGTVIVYRSDILHCGPDNRTGDPRFFFSVAYSRDIATEKILKSSYSLHSELMARSLTLEDLLPEPGKQPGTTGADNGPST